MSEGHLTGLPATADADESDLAEAAAIVADLGAGPTSLLDSLVDDLVAGMRGRPVAVTADDDLAELAAAQWRDRLTAREIAVLAPDGALGDDAARVHLHGGSRAAAQYCGAPHDNLGGDLVGEIFGQGESAAARYRSLVAVGDALAERMRAEDAND